MKQYQVLNHPSPQPYIDDELDSLTREIMHANMMIIRELHCRLLDARWIDSQPQGHDPGSRTEHLFDVRPKTNLSRRRVSLGLSRFRKLSVRGVG